MIKKIKNYIKADNYEQLKFILIILLEWYIIGSTTALLLGKFLWLKPLFLATVPLIAYGLYVLVRGVVVKEETILNLINGVDTPIATIPAVIHPAICDWNQLGGKKFCLKYFNKQGKAFVDFYTERTLNNGKLCADFIFYSLSIPRKKELSVDGLRKILLAYQTLFLEKPLELDECFALYTLPQIEVLFTNPYNRSFLNSLGQYKKVPVARNLSDLKHMLWKINLEPAIAQINNKTIDGLTFKVLTCLGDYQKASQDFSNCVHRYWGSSELIICVYRQKVPVACLSIIGKELKDILSVSNRPCFEDGQIIEILLKEKVL